MENFRKLGIIEPILKAIKEQGFERPTLIQAKAVPLVLEKKDVIAGSATGSGKTLIFGAGIITFSERGKGIQALVLTPTRELAEQVGKALRLFSKHRPLLVAIVYGGVDIEPQIKALHYADVVVGTPGRILDHISRGTINLRNVRILVLDEADRMLDMGFIDDVRRIINECPTKRQTLLFSATITRDIAGLSAKYMKNPVKVSAQQYVDPKKLAQVYYNVQNNLKFALLVLLLRHEKAGLVMVFCNSRATVDFVTNNLLGQGIDATAIHAGFSQDKRTRVMSQFQLQKVHVLVCTDVASRGLDIPGVSHIYNYDIPKDSKQYIHRIGRTARAGKEGKAINLLDRDDHDNFARVLRDTDVKIIKQNTPYIQSVRIARPIRPFMQQERKRHNRFPMHIKHSGYAERAEHYPQHGPRQHQRHSGQVLRR